MYRSEDSGDVKDLYLKVGAPVILAVNLSTELANGSRGVVKSMSTESVEVEFDSINRTVTVVKYPFTVYSASQRKEIAKRKQVPLRLGFALTVHRAQGLTLDRVEIDCRHMWNPGQIGVAVGRAKEKKGLRVLNFRPKLVRPHSALIEDFYKSTSVALEDDCSCCMSTCILPEKSDLDVADVPPADDGDDGDGDEDGCDSDEEMIKGMEAFESNLRGLENPLPETPLEYVMPESVDIKTVLESGMYKTPATTQQRDLNTTLKYMMEKTDRTTEFSKNVWSELKSTFKKCIPLEESGKKKVDNKSTTAFYKAVTMFQQSAPYKSLVQVLFVTQSPKPTHYRACFILIQTLRALVVEEAVKKIKEEECQHEKPGNVREGSSAGRGKLRYIGGWCVATLKYRKKQTVGRNLYKKGTRSLTVRLDSEVRFLEQLVEHESYLLENSKDKESLMDVKRKQNLTGGLTNISDSAFDFFHALDDAIQKLETEHNMNKYGKDFYNFIQTELENNDDIFASWQQPFQPLTEDADIENDSIVKGLFNEVLAKYLRMSSAQFRKDFLRKIKVKKQEAHRKQIQTKGTVGVKKGAGKWGMEEIVKDDSAEKMISHRRLQSEILASDDFLQRNFTINNLVSLCKAYDVKVTKTNKQKVAEMLGPHILQVENMKIPEEAKTSSKVPAADKGTGKGRKSESKGRTGRNVADAELTDEAGTAKQCTKGKQLKRKSRTESKATAKISKVQYPCGTCEKECDSECVACDLCDRWFHLDCVKCTVEDVEEIDWFCTTCKTG